MKYIININQLVLSQTDLDLTDCAILDWLIVFCNSKSEKIEARRKKGYTQIDYQMLIDDMPILKIKSKGALTPRMARIEKAGYIEIQRNRHTNSYFMLTSKVDELFIKTSSSVHETKRSKVGAFTETNAEPGESVHETEPIINTIKNNTKLNSASAPVEPSKFLPEGAEILKSFEEVDPKNKTYYNNKTQRSACDFLIQEYSLDKVLSVIKILPKTNKLNYFPNICTPYDLKEKWVKLSDAFIKKKSEIINKKDKYKVAFAD